MILKKNGKDKKYLFLSCTLFYIGFFLLSFIFLNIFISSFLFIFHVSILPINIFISTILSILLNYISIKNNSNNNKKMFLISIIISFLVIIFSIYISGKIYDRSYDGNSYHKLTIGELSDGWNPIYEKVEDYDQNSNNSVSLSNINSVWVNHYAKASHIFAANIVKFTNKIESGKCINIISIVMLLTILSSVLLYKTKDILFTMLFGICVITCTTISSQIFTNYIDLLVYIYFFLAILFFFAVEKSKLFKNNNNFLITFFMTLIIGINIKFSSFAYLGIFCLAYYIWYIVRLKTNMISKEYFKQFTITSILAVMIAIFVVGLSVYPKNLVSKGHPFYPLAGADKIDIMTCNQPDYFKYKSPIEKFIISTFSKSENIMQHTKLEAQYKIPFSIYEEEIASLSFYDTRIGGNGLFFSGILIISFVALIICMIKLYSNDKILFYLVLLPILITIVMIFVLDESWWARYFPQLHLIVFFALIVLKNSKNEKANSIIYIILGILFINNFLVLNHNISDTLRYNEIIDKEFEVLEKNYYPDDWKCYLYTEYFQGALYNVLEREKNVYNIEIVPWDDENEKNLLHFKFMNSNDAYVLWRCE